ncbi:Hypothetical predicted protein [Pelobates cultripes]|uniref:Uncharacterized protein n=1 Tax=Pelobates cultripes TaxID=61616 RepID=A0AAD1RU22_PELCU|nr:Hypothetical predicted protein [Pelobates cultripes]
MEFAQDKIQGLKADYLPVLENVLADYMSRTMILVGEWKLHPSSQIDLMDLNWNAQVPKYFSLQADYRSAGQECLFPSLGLQSGVCIPYPAYDSLIIEESLERTEDVYCNDSDLAKETE